MPSTCRWMLALFLGLGVTTPAASGLETVRVTDVLRLGPLGPLAASPDDMVFSPEIDPNYSWPTTSSSDRYPVAWTQTMARESVAGVTWNAVSVRLDGPDEVTFRWGGEGDVRLYLDGVEIASGKTSVKITIPVARGFHRLLWRRASITGDPAELALITENATVTLSPSFQHAPSDYHEFRGVAMPGALSVSPDGRYLALQAQHPSAAGVQRSFEIRDLTTGRVTLVEPSASPIEWDRNSRALLYRRGNSLLLWQAKTGRTRTILHDEPGLGAVALDDRGELVVFASTRGTTEVDTQQPQRRTELRQRLSDWPTLPHLHLLDLGSGIRRRLTTPSDLSQDAFDVVGRSLVYLQNVPLDERPWFLTEVRRRDLATGDDTKIASLHMGFENRPGLSGFAVSPDGQRAAFVGPPSELGRHATVEVNAFDPDLYIMQLDDGSWFKASDGLDASVDGGLRWSPDGSALWFQVTEGSRHSLARWSSGASGSSSVGLYSLPEHLERVHAVTFSDDGSAWLTASATATLPAMFHASGTMTGNSTAPWTAYETPNHDLGKLWHLSKPTTVNHSAEDGTPLEGWLYRPHGTPPPDGWPVIVYYYGGATPTLRGFNELHQFIVARGYALYVVNPRGAAGYGQSFADHHAGDWGSVAGADILAGVSHLLAQQGELDAQRVGCYGGSYGGFMTMWLLTQSDLFAAGVSLYGISHLASYWGDGLWGWTYGDQAMAGRTPATHPDWFTAQSPITHAAKITTPLLLLHGDSDSNVPASESEQMFTAMKLLQKDVELVRFPGEDHGLRGTWDHRVEHRTMLVEWFDKHLKDEPEAWTSRWNR